MKAVMNSTPASRWPCGKKISAPAVVPAVPTSVTASGLIPSLTKRLTNGASMTLCQKCLNLSNMTPRRLPPGEVRADAQGRTVRRTEPLRLPSSGVPHERQVASSEHVQEVRQVDQGEARRETRRRAGRTRQGARGDQEAVTAEHLTLGVIGSSSKENEHRLPLHPEHFARIPVDLQQRITLEHGYGARFRYAESELANHVAGFATREEILAGSDVVLLPKPQHADVAMMKPGAVLWGWPHCVQDPEITQLAIDRGLTMIAFEAMNHWTVDGSVGLHVFHKNNELAGYSSVIHALA